MLVRSATQASILGALVALSGCSNDSGSNKDAGVDVGNRADSFAKDVASSDDLAGDGLAAHDLATDDTSLSDGTRADANGGDAASARDLSADQAPLKLVKSIPVHGKDNCILLNATTATRATIPTGNYDVTPTGAALYKSGGAFKNVLVFHPSPAGGNVGGLWSLAGTTQAKIRSGYGFFAFFVDWYGLDDNTGSVTLPIGDTDVVVNAKTNCLLLDDTPAVKESVPAGSYTVKVTGQAEYAPGAAHQQVFVRYTDPQQADISRVWKVGSTVTADIASGYGFYAFFADWSSINDNSGVVTLEFYQ